MQNSVYVSNAMLCQAFSEKVTDLCLKHRPWSVYWHSCSERYLVSWDLFLAVETQQALEAKSCLASTMSFVSITMRS